MDVGRRGLFRAVAAGRLLMPQYLWQTLLRLSGFFFFKEGEHELGGRSVGDAGESEGAGVLMIKI